MYSGRKEYRDDLVVITTKSIVRRCEAQRIGNDILQHLGGNGITLVDLGFTYNSLSYNEYLEYLSQVDLIDDLYSVVMKGLYHA